MRFATLVEKKRGVRDDIKYTRTNLKIIRLGIARTHGWVELTPTVPTSSSHRSSTVIMIVQILRMCILLFCAHFINIFSILRELNLSIFRQNALVVPSLCNL